MKIKTKVKAGGLGGTPLGKPVLRGLGSCPLGNKK